MTMSGRSGTAAVRLDVPVPSADKRQSAQQAHQRSSGRVAPPAHHHAAIGDDLSDLVHGVEAATAPHTASPAAPMATAALRETMSASITSRTVITEHDDRRADDKCAELHRLQHPLQDRSDGREPIDA